jgi:formylglycine-generating enzyme required for sulfatase activity
MCYHPTDVGTQSEEGAMIRRNPNLLMIIALLAFLIGCKPGSVAPTATPEPTTEPAPRRTRIRLSDGMAMVYVPSGEFVMGSTDEEVDEALQLCNKVHNDCQRTWFKNEQPAHTVALDPFWIDRTEVTNAQFAAFLNEQGDEAEGEMSWLNVWLDLESDYCLIEQVGGKFRPKNGYADHPMILVSWYGAATYCQWAGGRLPTEAEWEYAARGPDRPMYPWGDTFDGARLNYCDANCTFERWKDSVYDDGYARTAPVGNYLGGESWCGAVDMAGNVWEWVADWYAEDTYARSPSRNPQGADSGQFRVQRGGSWINDMKDMRSALRNRYPSSWQDHAVGFRCAVPIRESRAGSSFSARAGVLSSKSSGENSPGE